MHLALLPGIVYMYQLIRIFYNIMTSVTDILFHRFTVIACSECRIHDLPLVPVKFNDVIDPAGFINIGADPGVVGITGVSDFQFCRDIL